ncbi:MAG: lipid A export permease/ATP-binding protein MsbA [Gammaproteobacteria bacterium]|nr:lipid A export permease/ATP-binding protein MsbA [Gammaproteobacteria bacterium]
MKTPDSKPSSKETYLRLLGYLKPYRKQFAITIGAMILLGLSEAGIPALSKPLLDGGFVAKDMDSLKVTLGLLILLFFSRGLLLLLSRGMMGWISGKIVLDLRTSLFDLLLHLPTHYYDKYASGSIMSKITNNVTMVTSAATGTIMTLIKDSVMIVVLLSYALYLNWKLTLSIFIIFPPIILVAKAFSRRVRRFSHVNMRSLGEMTHILQESIKGHKIVKIHDGREYEKQRFFKVANRIRQFQQKALLAGAGNTAVVEIIAAVSVSVVIVLSTLYAIQEQQSIGHLFAFYIALGLTLAPAKRLASAMQPLQKGLAAAETIFELLDEEKEKDRGTHELHRVNGDILFHNVSFSYPGANKQVLKNINLNLKKGMNIALVGHSGSGKTTIANLIPRFYDIDQGSITLDGMDLRDIKLKSLREQIAIVSQDIVLFNDSVVANITYGMSPLPTMEQIKEAIKLANAEEFVSLLPEGIDTQLGEDGATLSGGQRQRLAITRAFLKNAPLLILDEATSALDTKTEEMIEESLTRLKSRKTTITIAHRLSTIINADVIYVMKDGEIDSMGSHAELLENSGLYRQLYQTGNLESATTSQDYREE